jgi:hypothetical protein
MSHELPPDDRNVDTFSDDVPVSKWHLKIVAERFARYGDSREGFMSLENFMTPTQGGR